MKAKQTKQQIEVKISGETISIISFADNIVITTENEEDVINEMEETFTTFKMEINEKRTKILICVQKL